MAKNPYTSNILSQMQACLAHGGKVWAMSGGASIRVHKVELIPDASDDGPYFAGVMGGGTPVRFTAFHTSDDEGI